MRKKKVPGRAETHLYPQTVSGGRILAILLYPYPRTAHVKVSESIRVSMRLPDEGLKSHRRDGSGGVEKGCNL